MTQAAATAHAQAAARGQRPSGRPLPRAGHILAVTARPGQESADLGRLLYAFRRRGASLGLLTLTRGEASPLNSTCERLEAIRLWELQVAAGLLGISALMVAEYPDGQLNRQPAAELTERVRRAIRQHATDLLLVIDPATADPDDAAVARGGVRRRRADRRPGPGPHAARRPQRLARRPGYRRRGRACRPARRPGRARQPGQGPALRAAAHRPAGRPRATVLAGPAPPHVHRAG